ncbi:MAG TPA: hypothetical protein VHP11_12450, partial [Tepidisphaeraceae bacterium]|nr:hypothetical protein [Tepidisphaeraceae bacterium]
MADAKLDLLNEAIARNAAAVLSLPSAGLLHHSKSRFLAQAPGGFWIESDPNQRTLLDELIAKKARVGMAFKTGTERIIFAAPVLLRDPSYSLNRQMTLEALLLALPEHLTAVQRRANYRVVIPESAGVMARVWKIPSHWNLRDRPPASMEVAVKVRDLSTSGIGLLCAPKDGQPIAMASDCRLRILVKREDIQ